MHVIGLPLTEGHLSNKDIVWQKGVPVRGGYISTVFVTLYKLDKFLFHKKLSHLLT